MKLSLITVVTKSKIQISEIFSFFWKQLLYLSAKTVAKCTKIFAYLYKWLFKWQCYEKLKAKSLLYMSIFLYNSVSQFLLIFYRICLLGLSYYLHVHSYPFKDNWKLWLTHKGIFLFIKWRIFEHLKILNWILFLKNFGRIILEDKKKKNLQGVAFPKQFHERGRKLGLPCWFYCL